MITVQTKNLDCRDDLIITLELDGSYKNKLNVNIKRKDCPYDEGNYCLDIPPNVRLLKIGYPE